MNPIAKQWATRVGNSAVIWSFVAVGLRLASTLLLLPLILRRVPAEHLGLWYVFLAIGALAPLVDFGFAPTVSRLTAYAWAGVTELNPIGLPTTAPAEAGLAAPNYTLLAKLVASLRAYYRGVGLLLFLIMGIGGGAWIWHKSAALADANSLRVAWIVYALGSCVSFMNSLWSDLLVGINGVRQSQQTMVIGQITFYVIAIVGLLAGGSVWSLVIASVISGLATRFLLRSAFVKLSNWLGKLPLPRLDRAVLAIMWPNAWRTGLVSVASYTIVQANTIICSVFLDLRTTASYGLSVQIITTLVGVSAVWLSVKFPLINQMRAHGRSEAIVPLFINRMHLAILTYLAGAATCIIFLPSLLHLIGSRTNILPREMLIIFFFFQFLEMHHSMYACLVYSENTNPFLVPALVSGGFIVTLSLFLTPRIGVWGLILSAGLVQLCFNNWWPVLRALRGLGESGRNYWRRFFNLRDVIARVCSASQ